MCNVAPGGTVTIEIHVASSQVGSASQLVRDKFLITVVGVEQTGMQNQQIAEVMKVRELFIFSRKLVFQLCLDIFEDFLKSCLFLQKC